MNCLLKRRHLIPYRIRKITCCDMAKLTDNIGKRVLVHMINRKRAATYDYVLTGIIPFSFISVRDANAKVRTIDFIGPNYAIYGIESMENGKYTTIYKNEVFHGTRYAAFIDMKVLLRGVSLLKRLSFDLPTRLG